MRLFTTTILALLLAACGSGTEPNTQLLLANVEETDVPDDVRPTLSGAIEHAQEVQFPDGEGKVRFTVAHGRAAGPGVPSEDARVYLRSITVHAVDSAGYDLTAVLFGNPTNSGTEERPIHTRLVQIQRTRSGLTGTSSSTMTVRVTPTSVEAI